MKTFFSVFISILLFSHLNFLIAQYQLGEKWVARYNGTLNGVDQSNSVKVDASGNVYVTGMALVSGIGSFTTIKYNTIGTQQWLSSYSSGWSPPAYGKEIEVDGNGNVYVTGYGIYGSTNTGGDYVVIKYNSSGVQQWVQRYNGTGNGNDEVSDIALDASGNVYVTGKSPNNMNNTDYATVKFNSSGVQQWVQRYDGTGQNNDAATELSVDVSGNVYVTGYSRGSASGDDCVTIKYNSAGVQQWLQRYNGPSNSTDFANAIVVDGSGNVIIAGGSYGVANGTDYLAVKYNSSGVLQWAVNYVWFFEDAAYDAAVENAGSIYITGSSAGSTSGNTDIVTMKISSAGSAVWSNRYNGPGNSDDAGNSILIDNLGNLYVSGYSSGASSGADYVLLRYSTSGGSPLTEKRYNGSVNGNDRSLKSVMDANGCVYLTGYSLGSNYDDYCTIKYVPLAAAPVLVSPANNSTGISCTPLLNWNDVVNADTYTVQVSTNSGFTSFNVNQSGLTASQYQVVTGSLQNNVLYYWRACAVNTAGTGPWSTVWSFRTALVGIQPVSIEIPEVYKLYSNSPNPFNPSTDIRFDIPKAGFVILKVFDAYGKEIETIVNETLTPGKYNAVFNGGNLSSGVYFYHFFTDYFSDTKKMVLVK